MESSNDLDSMSTRHRRKSAFVEIGLVDQNPIPSAARARPRKALRFNSTPDIFEYTDAEASDSSDTEDSDKPSLSAEDYDQDLTLEAERLARRRAELRQGATMYRLSVAGLVLAILVPLMHGSPWLGSAPSVPGIGVTGGPLRRDPAGPILDPVKVERRDDSPTDFCFRWAQMTAVVNGTLYIYGGQAAAKSESAAGTWDNDFLTLDLTSNWSIANAPLTGLPQPSGPPNVSLGALWNSYDSLFLYGGEFSSDPPETPTPYSLWEYQIAQSNWVEHQNPQTSAGQFSTGAGIDVGRAAEGAGIAVPALGRAWYFGGHQDAYTTPGWSVQIWRIYLTSLLEYTFPGRTNDQVTSLENGATADSYGVWRNITSGGLQTTNGFPERADGLLIYVPGYGPEGILVGLAGGTNDTFQQMSQVDIYDIANSKWYKQATSGPTPGIRVNPCAVIASAPDGSTQNIYMFGGQNLQPAGAQTQYNDMWILTIPSFTWIQVDQSSQAVPYARAGHTCNVWNAQMVVVGGYVSPELSCDSPGVYVFDMSNLEWKTTYNTLSVNANGSPQSNPLNQQPAQFGVSGDKAGLEGSYGYSVPPAVVSVVGGNAQGGATVTAPAVIPTDGPLKTGQPIIYTSSTTSGSPGATGSVGGTGSSSSTSAPGHTGGSTTSVGAIVAGVVAGVLALVVAYLAFCLWLYRRRLALYKRHLDMARASWGSAGETTPFAATGYHAAACPNKDDGENSPFATSQAERVDSNDGSRPSGQGSGSGSGSGSANERPGARDTSGSLHRSSVEDLIAGGEPSFWGTMLSPKRSLRVTNRD